jgi:putative DNA primase/helicase
VGRAADNWEPLAQIAEVAGGAWPDIAQKAALHLSGDSGQTAAIGDELLADVRQAFGTLNVQRISTRDLLDELCRDEERPWATWAKGHNMTARQLGRMLDAYGVSSRQVKIDHVNVRGFEIGQFADAFERYLASSPEKPVLSATTLPANTGAGFAVAEGHFGEVAKNASATGKPLLDKEGSVVAGKNPEAGEDYDKVSGDVSKNDTDETGEGGEL